MYFDFFKKYFHKKEKVGKTNIYFHNFCLQQPPKNFDTLSFTDGNQTVGDVFNTIRGILKIHQNSPMQAYAVKDINKMHYSWLYSIKRNGYGPKGNFKKIAESSPINEYENILVNYHHSQHNEDYIVQKIFNKIKTSNKYFVEFGAGDGETISNTILLRYDGWRGLLVEPGKWFNTHLPNATCLQDFLTPENIESVFEKAGVPEVFDFLSIDVDDDDYYLWQALNRYKPRVLLIEVDGVAKDAGKLESYEKPGDGPKSSISSMTELCKKKGYTLLYVNGSNAFYVNNSDYSNYFKPVENITPNRSIIVTADLF